MSYQLPPKDMEKTWMYISKWKNQVWEGYILYDSNYMTFWEKKYCGDSNVSSCQGLVEGEGCIGRAQRTFRLMKLFCMIL